MIRLKMLLWTLLAMGFAKFAHSEPWLSNRFAQNCSACHAPGRVNVPAAERRCTLSCQGCHTNPNGGGLRNHYGRWNQQRWLTSFSTQSWRLQQERPLPFQQQEYAPSNIKDLLTDEKAEPGSEKRKELAQRIVEEGLKLKSSPELISESEFDRNRGAFEKTLEPNRQKFMTRIPQGDPLRSRQTEITVAGGDLRFFNLNRDRSGEKSNRSAPMAADISVQLQAFSKLSMVTEARFANAPTNPQMDQLYTSNGFVRSAYLLVDDLSYNTFLMGGIYRPLFGHPNPDHNSISSVVTGMSYDAAWKAFSIGTAPNVPFLNFHLIQPMTLSNQNQDRGWAVNLGGRFVTLGASITLSYWDTKARDANTGTEAATRTMSSVALGGIWNNWVIDLDLLRVKLGTPSTLDEGAFVSWENRYRIWREFYLVGLYSTGNTAISAAKSKTAPRLDPGTSSEVQFGIKSFLVSGVEFELMSIARNETIKDRVSFAETSSSTDRIIQTQLHFFY